MLTNRRRRFATRSAAGPQVPQKLLWLYVTDPRNQGELTSITEVQSELGTWKPESAPQRRRKKVQVGSPESSRQYQSRKGEDETGGRDRRVRAHPSLR